MRTMSSNRRTSPRFSAERRATSLARQRLEVERGQERGGVALEPGVAQEVAGGGSGAVERVAAVRDDAGGDLQQRFAVQEREQRPPVVDAVPVPVARAVGEQAHPFGEGGASQRERDADAFVNYVYAERTALPAHLLTRDSSLWRARG